MPHLTCVPQLATLEWQLALLQLPQPCHLRVVIQDACQHLAHGTAVVMLRHALPQAETLADEQRAVGAGFVGTLAGATPGPQVRACGRE